MKIYDSCGFMEKQGMVETLRTGVGGVVDVLIVVVVGERGFDT